MFWKSVALALAIVVCGVWAQVRTSSISGTVRDESGAVVSGASIRIVSLETNRSRLLSTGPEGTYQTLALEAGRYEVTAEKPGFRLSRHQDVVVEVNREAVVNPILHVGEAASSVEVADDSRLVDATPSAVTNVVTSKFVEELPLNGRDYLQLSLLQPGVVVARSKSRNGNTGYGLQLSIGGSRPVQNNFRLDGISLTDYTGSTTGSVNGLNLGVDALREFSILTSGFSAEYGRAAGGVVNAVTRSGSNQFHANLAWFHRNDNLDARNFFDPRDQPEFRRHQYSASAGGPLRPDRTFYFAAYEGFRQLRGNTDTSTTISDAARRGVLLDGRPVSLDPSIARVLPFFPSPNGPVSGDTGLFTFSNNVLAREDFFTARLDHHFSDTFTVFSRYSFDNGSRDELTDFAAGRAFNRTRRQSAVLEATRIFSPHLTNSLRFGLSRAFSLSNLTQPLDPALDDPAFVFVPGSRGMGRIDVAGLSLFPGGSGAIDFDRNAFTSFQIYDDLNYARGRHWVKAGVMLERTRFNSNSQNLNAGEFRFPSVRDFLENRSDRFRAILPGTDTIRGFRQWIPAWYLQDRWRLRPNFSLELGLRHEWITVPVEVQGKLSNLDTLLSPAVRTTGPLFENPSFRNFAPRAGFAWDLTGSGSTLLRGGFGLFYDQILSQFLLIAGLRNPPYYLGASIQGLATGLFPSLGYSTLVSRPSPDLRAERLPRYPSQPYVEQWNFNLQQSLGPLGQFRAAYAGSHGLHLSVLVEDANLAPSITLPDGRLYFPAGGARLNPNFGVIRDRLFEGQSFYHSLQAGWERSSRSGTRLSTAYLFSKSIDDDSATFSQSESENSIGLPVTGNSRFNRGLSNHDQRHNFVASLTAPLPAPASSSLRPLLRGWLVSSIATAASGNPFTATLAYDAARTLTLRADRRGGQRPDLKPGFSGHLTTGNPAGWINLAAFARPAPGFLGNLGRNTLTGPGLFSLDAALVRTFSFLSDRPCTLDLRFEAFNLFNHTNFDLPSADRMQIFTRSGILEDAGRITSAAPGREIQIGIKVRF